MSTSPAPLPRPYHDQLEDPLAHLPYSKVIEYRKRQVIYDSDQGPAGLYLVISGHVKVALPVDGARDVVVDIYRTDDFFGETTLLGRPRPGERAIALDRVRLMMWPTNAIVEIMNNRPRLPLALLQALVQRTTDLRQRIRNLHAGTVERRLADSLRGFAERSGVRRTDGAVRISPLTHELLAQYVGTSREAITLYMTRLRRHGYIEYNRQEMIVHLDALKNWLRQPE
jgi:CRP-like cAMP-binding protein